MHDNCKQVMHTVIHGEDLVQFSRTDDGSHVSSRSLALNLIYTCLDYSGTEDV